jgi:hypothetical protein
MEHETDGIHRPKRVTVRQVVTEGPGAIEHTVAVIEEDDEGFVTIWLDGQNVGVRPRLPDA